MSLLVLLVGCSSPEGDEVKRLPGATHSPHLQSSANNVACGAEIAFYGSPTPDIVYAYTYNAAGNLTGVAEENYWGDTAIDMAIAYDASQQIVGYTYDVTGPDWSGSWSAAYSNFVGPHQPAREVATADGQSMGYDLSYDTWGRLVAAEADSGEVTTYTYDDTNLTITYDHGNGAWTGVVQFAADGRELSETWGGNDPNAVPAETVFNWTGFRLDSVEHTYDGDLVETDSFVYNCAAARQGVNGRTVRIVRPGTRTR